MTNNMTIAVDLGRDITYELLIEQHDGYEKTKRHRDYLVDFGSEFAGVSPDEIRMLNTALLEYRRAYNIFEVGDAIIRKWNGKLHWIIADVDNGSEFMISKNENAKFKDCKVCDMPCNFTHATDAEIEANRRLDQ